MDTVVEPKVQLRKLNFRHQRVLEDILDSDDLWKKLMCVIPKTLNVDPFKCNICRYNLPKYNTEHFKIVESVSKKDHRSCTNILFEEWGTSGRILPTLAHLLYLLKKAELYRAADFVCEILGQSRPERPQTGPAALINIDSVNLKDLNKGLTSILDGYSRSNNQESERPSVNVVPSSNSGNSQSEFIPALQELLHQSNGSPIVEENISESQLPNFDAIQLSNSQSAVESGVPNLSILGHSSSHYSSGNNSSQSNSGGSSIDHNFPNISIFNHDSQDSVTSVPNLSVFHHTNIIPSINISSETDNSYGSSSGSRKCTSPLPNLSLNTTLPHFTYMDLEKATNEFNDEPFTTEDEIGRFLGKGAFGTVYIAFNLTDKPIAVKKLVLDAVDITNMASVTKQFCNEVEILSKYKHDNLLSLLGFSCDGCTYCLVYEYISGGSLKDRLQAKDNKLIWTDRVYIALGTAKAVSYLHTAFKDPVIHRDIKSANILLDSNNKPKLGDFGLIRNIYNKKTSTFTTPIGTSSYMPTEAFRGEISDKVDTYSFGIVLLELLTALPVFDEDREDPHLGDYVEEKYEKGIDCLLDKTAGSWSTTTVSFGEELFQIAFKCLEEKKKRPAMMDVTKMLSDVLEKIL